MVVCVVGCLALHGCLVSNRCENQGSCVGLCKGLLMLPLALFCFALAEDAHVTRLSELSVDDLSETLIHTPDKGEVPARKNSR